jgi:hypothetical protein
VRRNRRQVTHEIAGGQVSAAMTFLPIAERELRVRARQKATFRVRVGAALVASLIIAFFLLMSRVWFSPGKLGQGIFWLLSGLAFLWCLLEGPRNTADSLSEEKREGTLGLLFLTDLKSYDVVLGKLLATSLNSFYCVLAILPPLAIPLLLGGVTPGEFWRMVLLLIATLFFSLSVGMFISAASRDERRAWFGTVVLVFFVTAIPPMFGWLPLAISSLLGWCSPFFAFVSLTDVSFWKTSHRYWHSILGVHLLTWAFFAAACFVLPHSWQDKPLQRANRETIVARRRGDEVVRRRLMYQNPVVWMLSRHRASATPVWLVVLLTTVPALAISLFLRGASLLVWPYIICAMVLHIAIAVWVAAQACFLVADARNSGALDLLLTTPVKPRQIIDGHVEALQRQFLAPIAVLCLLELVVSSNFVGFNARQVGELWPFTIVVAMMLVAMIAADLLAVTWFGLWMGLTNKRSAHAVAKTVIYVLVLPLVLLGCTFLWPIAAIVKDFLFANYARTRLSQQFRNVVAEGVTRSPWAGGKARPSASRLPNLLDK